MPVLNGLTGRLWPMHPHRQNDELLSSWIAHTAYANRLKLQSFTTLAFGRQATLWNRDIDCSATDSLIEHLSEQTGSPVEEVRAGMLSGYESLVFERHNPKGCTKWILPIGVYHRTRKSFGLQFCPLCLFFDMLPYYRRRWRLGFATVCDVHGTLLHDRCPQCGAPVVFFRNDLGYRSGYRLGDMVSCWKCDFDLRRAPALGPPGPDWKSLMTLRSLVTFHDMGWWHQGDRTLHFSPLYFGVLHHLVTLLGNTWGQRLLAAINHEVDFRGAIQPHCCRTTFERKPVRERHALLTAALWLLDDWTDRFVQMARKARLTQSRILRGEPLPFWFESEIRLEFGSGQRVRTAEEARSAAAYLVKTDRSVSASAVAKLIGSNSIHAAKAYARIQHRTISPTEFEQLLAALDGQIAGLKPRCPKRLLLQRDKAIIRLIHLTGWSARQVLRLTVGDAVRLATTPRESRTLPGEVAGMLMNYLRNTRQYLAGDDSDNALFIGWKRGRIGEKDWRVRRKALIALLRL